jgi:hypothetical protein
MSEFNPYAGPHTPEAGTAAPASAAGPERPPEPDRDAARSLFWLRFWACVGLVVGVVVTFVGTTAASTLVYFGQAAECNEIADSTTVREGIRSLLIVLAVAAVPWGLALYFTRHRIVVSLAALVALLPVLYAILHGLTPGAWDDGWCF